MLSLQLINQSQNIINNSTDLEEVFRQINSSTLENKANAIKLINELKEGITTGFLEKIIHDCVKFVKSLKIIPQYSIWL